MSADDVAAVRAGIPVADDEAAALRLPSIREADEARAALDRLAARLQEAERERDAARGWANDQQPDLVQLLRVRAEAAEAREAALREALDWIEAEPEDPAKVQARARAALAEKP